MSDEEQEELEVCCLCGHDIEHEMFPNGGYFGNNPHPFQPHHAEWVVKLADRCCDWCNDMKVNPARFGLTGKDAEIMGRILIRAKAVQMHLMKQYKERKKTPEGACEK